MGLYKSKGLKQANATLNKWFSIYVRIRDSDENGIVKCFTCDHSGPWNDGFDAGHFVDADKLPTRWDEFNVHAQCKKCNLSANGQQYRHGQAIEWFHGKDVAEELLKKAEEDVTITKKERMRMAREYKRLAEQMAQQKGIEL